MLAVASPQPAPRRHVPSEWTSVADTRDSDAAIISDPDLDLRHAIVERAGAQMRDWWQKHRRSREIAETEARPVLLRQPVGGLAAEPHDHPPQAAVFLEVPITSRWLPLPMVSGLTVVLDVLLWVRSLEVRGWWRCIVVFRPYPTPSFSRLLLCMPPQLF